MEFEGTPSAPTLVPVTVPQTFPTWIFIITLLGYKMNSENMTLLQILQSYTNNNLQNGAQKWEKNTLT